MLNCSGEVSFTATVRWSISKAKRPYAAEVTAGGTAASEARIDGPVNATRMLLAGHEDSKDKLARLRFALESPKRPCNSTWGDCNLCRSPEISFAVSENSKIDVSKTIKFGNIFADQLSVRMTHWHTQLATSQHVLGRSNAYSRHRHSKV